MQLSESEENKKIVIFESDDAHPPSTDEIAKLLFEDESDPRSNNYKRKLSYPKIAWHCLFIYVLIPATIGVISWKVMQKFGIAAHVVTLLIGILALVYLLLMLKPLVVSLIKIYQLIAPTRIREKCRFEPSCSDYMLIAIQKYGLCRGIRKGFSRLKRCKIGNGGVDEP